MDYESDPTVVEVTVTVATGPDGKVEVTCSPNPVNVMVPNSLLVFGLGTRGFHFRNTGAVVIAGTFDDFPYPSWTLDAMTAGLLDLCNEADDFDYTVTVLRNDDGAEFSVDPIIQNGGTV